MPTDRCPGPALPPEIVLSGLGIPARRQATGAKLERQEPDGSMVIIAEQHANEIVVDAVGNAYVNGGIAQPQHVRPRI